MICAVAHGMTGDLDKGISKLLNVIPKKDVYTLSCGAGIGAYNMENTTKTVNASIADIVSGRLSISEIHNRLHAGEHILFNSFSPEETYLLGRQLGERCGQGEVYALSGDLGVGKTLFTQGFAAGLDIPEPVSSPTFTILQVYDTGRLPFYHFDVYRIGDVEEMEEVGWEDCIYGGGVCIVEWAELIQEILPSKRFQILIEKDPTQGFDYRRITVYYEDSGTGQFRPGGGSSSGGR